MEWVKIDLKSLQKLKTGFFHVDPHHGNIAIDVDESLIYYDFGIMRGIKPFTRARMMDLFYAFVMNNMISLGALQPTDDILLSRHWLRGLCMKGEACGDYSACMKSALSRTALISTPTKTLMSSSSNPEPIPEHIEAQKCRD
ncbi:hypothetical protein Ccrd_010367, partial [Cynara cardunculus var. scolymus]